MCPRFWPLAPTRDKDPGVWSNDINANTSGCMVQIWIISDMLTEIYTPSETFTKTLSYFLKVSEILTSSPNQEQGPWSLE